MEILYSIELRYIHVHDLVQSDVLCKTKTWLASNRDHYRMNLGLPDYRCSAADILISSNPQNRKVLGNWQFHLSCASWMFNFLTARWHYNYAKSACLYLEMMLQLPADYPLLYDKFMHEGYHAVRRRKRLSRHSRKHCSWIGDELHAMFPKLF